ncbi:hypothetical protein [Terricaulis sp.]|uniref:hypothetical protein n=1 Tax=Terricaulis sp. TaxID=2768686 RepID=UPI0037852BF9
MTVILRRNEALELNLVEYRGRISLAELQAVAKFQADKPNLLASDCLNRVCADADFGAITFAMLDTMHEHYSKLFAPLRLQIFRRAAWFCEAEGPRGHVAHWLSQDTRETMSSTVKHCHTFADAADWLLLMDAERGMLERGEGFDEIARFDGPPEPAAVLTR